MARNNIDSPDSTTSVGWTRAEQVCFGSAADPFTLDAGGAIGPVEIEYETYGRLSPARDNVILICHALSGDAHAAGWDSRAKETGRIWRMRKPGWWDSMIGPDKPIDTNRFFVICSNFLGSCYGTTGPASTDPSTGRPYGMTFPMITVGDWVRLQAMLLDHLEIPVVNAAIGGSLGGQQVIEWAMAYPERVRKAIVLAASPRLSTQGLAFNAVGRHAILNDPDFSQGDYYDKEPPRNGLAAARMLAHITYLSDQGMREKFGRRLQDKETPDFGFGVEFEVESYLDYQGRSFVERFDANSYLYITRAMDYYDAAQKWGQGDLVAACRRVQAEVMVASFSSDWLYQPADCKEFAFALSRCNKPATYVNVPSPYGHDAFLVETGQVGRLLASFLGKG